MGISAEKLLNKLLMSVGFYIPKSPADPKKPDAVDFNINWFTGPLSETKKTLRSKEGQDAIEGFFTELTRYANLPAGTADADKDKAKPAPFKLTGTTAEITSWRLHEKVGGVQIFSKRSWAMKAGSTTEREKHRTLLGLWAGAEAGPLRVGVSAALVDLGHPDDFPVQLASNADKLWLGATLSDLGAADAPKFPLRLGSLEWRPFEAVKRPTLVLESFAYKRGTQTVVDPALSLPAGADWAPKDIADLVGYFGRNWVRYAALREERSSSSPPPKLARRLRDHGLPMLGYYPPELKAPTDAISAIKVGDLLSSAGAEMKRWGESWVAGAAPWPPRPPPRVVEGLLHVLALTGLIGDDDKPPAKNGSVVVWVPGTGGPQLGLAVDWVPSQPTQPTPAGLSWEERGSVVVAGAARLGKDFTLAGQAWTVHAEARAGAQLDVRVSAAANLSLGAGASASASVGASASAAWAVKVAIEPAQGSPGLDVAVEIGGASAALKVERIALGFEGAGAIVRPVVDVYASGGLTAPDPAKLRSAALSALKAALDAAVGAAVGASPELGALVALVTPIAQDPAGWLARAGAALTDQIRAWSQQLVAIGIADLDRIFGELKQSALPAGVSWPGSAAWAFRSNLDINAALEGLGLRVVGDLILSGDAAGANGAASGAVTVAASGGLLLDVGLPVGFEGVQPGFSLGVDAGLKIGASAAAAGSASTSGASATGSVSASVAGSASARVDLWLLEDKVRTTLVGARFDSGGTLSWTLGKEPVAALTADLKKLVTNTVVPTAIGLVKAEVQGALTTYKAELAALGTISAELFSGKDVSAILPTVGQTLWDLATNKGTIELPFGLKLVSGGVHLPDLSMSLDTDPVIEVGLRGLKIDQLLSAPQPAFGTSTAGPSGLYLTARGAQGRPLLDAGIGVGAVTVSVVPFGAGAPRGAISLTDIRLPFGSGGSGLEAGLMPKDGANPGFSVEVAWDPAKSPPIDVTFKGKVGPVRIPLGLDLGPLQVRALSVDFKDNALHLSPDVSLSLAGLEVVPIGFGLKIPVEKLQTPELWQPTLSGIGVGFDNGAVRIAGLLYRDDTGDYKGAASLKFGTFELGAIAGFKMIKEENNPKAVEEPSFFAFVYVPVPLGGPPFFFVTGLAGGVGVNRALPAVSSPAKIADHPFIFAMGKGSVLEAAKALDGISAERGTFWLAVGVKFRSFGIIEGKAVAYVKINPNRFELRLLALATMDLAGMASVELAVDGGLIIDEDPTLFVKAELTGNSWLLDRNCKLTGGFAFQVWPKRGDAVLTLGGYHPRFDVPKHYPSVPRVGFNWAMSSALVAKGEVYFALTPRALMAGGRLEVRGSWGPLEAWLIAFLDAYISWDPWFFDLGIGIEIGVSLDTGIFGRISLSLGVELLLFGPPLGGHAIVKVCGMSFKLPIGSPTRPALPRPKIREFFEKNLGLASEPYLSALRIPNIAMQKAAAGTAAKPVRRLAVEVERGVLRPDGAGSSAEPDAVRGPLDLVPEFVLNVRSPVPITEATYQETAGVAAYGTLVASKLVTLSAASARFHIEPSDIEIGRSTLSILMRAPEAGMASDAITPTVSILPLEGLPWAQWGRSTSKTGQREPDAGPSTIQLQRGVRVDARWKPVGGRLVPLIQDYSTGKEGWSHRLPLGLSQVEDADHPIAVAAGLPTHVMAMSQLSTLNTALAAELTRRRAGAPRVVEPLANLVKPSRAASERVWVAPAAARRVVTPRPTRAAATRLATHRITGALGVQPGLRSTVEGWASAAHVAPPALVPRGAAVGALELVRRLPALRTTPAAAVLATPRTVARIKASHAGALAGLVGAGWSRLASASAARPAAGALDLAAGDTLRVDVKASEALRVVLSGDQPVRVVALDAAGWPLMDALGQTGLALPRGTAHVVTQGYGRERSGVADAPTDGGFVADSALVHAVDSTWVGPRCVVRAIGVSRPTDGDPRRAGPLLAAASEVLVWLPAVEGSLVVVLDDPAAASQGGLRVHSHDLALGEPQVLYAGRRLALIYAVSARHIWRVDVSTRGGAGLSVARALAMDPETVAGRLRSDWSWLAPTPARPFGASRLQLARSAHAG